MSQDVVAAFVTALPARAQAAYGLLAPPARASLEAELTAAVAHARAEAGLTLEATQLAAFWGERVPDDSASLTDGWAALHKGDLALACACLAGEPAALARFEREALANVPAFLGHLRLQPAMVEDVQQRLRERLLVGGDSGRPRLCDYRGRGPLGAFVRVAATRLALDHKESEERHAPPREELAVSRLGTSDADPELDFLRQRYQGAFAQCFQEALATLDPADRNLLRWYFIDELTVAAIGQLIGLDKSNVSRRLARVRRAVFDETQRLLREQLRLSPTELHSIFRLVRSQLDVSLRSRL